MAAGPHAVDGVELEATLTLALTLTLTLTLALALTLTPTLALALALTLTLGGSENLTSHYIFLLGMYVPPLGLG